MSKLPKKIICEGCNKEIKHPKRTDTKFHNHKCRYLIRQENAKILIPEIPQSGIPGITYHRTHRSWQIMIKTDGCWKYIGTAKDLTEAIKFRNYVMNG